MHTQQPLSHKMKQQHQQETPFRLLSGRRPSLWGKQDLHRRVLPHPHSQQPREHQGQHRIFEQEQQEAEPESEAPDAHLVEHQPQTWQSLVLWKKENSENAERKAALSRRKIPAISLLRALWPGARDVPLASEEVRREESDIFSSSKRCPETRSFRGDSSSSRSSAAFLTPLGSHATAEHNSPAAAGLHSCPPLPSGLADTKSSFDSSSSSSLSSGSRRATVSVADHSSATSLPLKASSFFATWLPTPASNAPSSSSPRVTPVEDSLSSPEASIRRVSSAGSQEATCSIPLPRGSSSQGRKWSCGSKAFHHPSYSSTSHLKPYLERGVLPSQRARTSSKDLHRAGHRETDCPSPSRDAGRIIGDSRSVSLTNECRSAADHSLEQAYQGSALDEIRRSTASAVPAPADSESAVGLCKAIAGACRSANASALVPGEEREADGSSETANTVQTRRHLVGANDWEQYALRRWESSRYRPTHHGEVHAAERHMQKLMQRAILTGRRGTQGSTCLQPSRRGFSVEGRTGDLFFSVRRPCRAGVDIMAHPEYQRQQPSSRTEGEAIAAASLPLCTHEKTLNMRKDRTTCESNNKTTGEADAPTSSSSSFGWMDQLRKVLRQTSLLGGSSAAAAKKASSRSSSVGTPVTSLEEIATEEELSDTELLLLQGVSICKLPEDSLLHTSHGSEPCNVLVCVEPSSAAGAPSGQTVVAAAAVSDATADSTAAEVAVAALPPTTCSSGTSSTRSSGESFSGLWEGTSFLPPSLASLAGAVNLRPWLTADTTASSAPVPSPAVCVDGSSSTGTKSNSSGSSSSTSNNASSDSSTAPVNIRTAKTMPLFEGGKPIEDRSTRDTSNGRSSAASHSVAPPVVQRRRLYEEDFHSLLARCRSSATTEASPVPSAPPLHALAVLQADGTARTYWRLSRQLQQQHQEQQHPQHRQQQQQSIWDEQQRSQQESKQGQHMYPHAVKQTAEVAGSDDFCETDTGKWTFIPLQQPTEEFQEETQDQQQQDDVGGSQARVRTALQGGGGGPAESAGIMTAEQQQQENEGCQQQQGLRGRVADGRHIEVNSSCPNSSSSADTVDQSLHFDAWSGAESKLVREANIPSEGNCGEGRCSTSNKESQGVWNRRSDERSSPYSQRCQEMPERMLEDTEDTAAVRDNLELEGLGGQETPQLQQKLQRAKAEHELPTSEARREVAQGSRKADGMSSSTEGGATGPAARGARSWAQSHYNTAPQHCNKSMHVQSKDMTGTHSSAARRRKDTHSALPRPRAEAAAGVLLGERTTAAAAAPGTAGPVTASNTGGPPAAAAKPARERHSQPQATGWWAEFSKGVTDFFTQQQGTLLPDVDIRHCENPPPLASSSSAAAKKQEPQGEASPAPTPLYPPLGFSFSPAGLLGPYHLGVVSLLCEANVINEYTPVAGASAGSLAAVAIGLNLPAAAVMNSVEHVSQDLKEKGTAQRLGKRLRKELNRIIPEDCAAMIGKRPGKVTVTYTHVFPYIHGAFVSSFSGKSDLIDCLMASCNIPFYFTKWPTITCRGRQCVDGFFATKHKTFGCPDTGALRDVKVVPFYASTVRLSSAAQDCINPDLQLHDKQILHYLRAKALLRARARLLRDQMEEQRQRQLQQHQQKGVNLQPEEGGQHVHLHEQEHREGRQHRGRAAHGRGGMRASDTVRDALGLLLPSICPIHGEGLQSQKQQQQRHHHQHESPESWTTPTASHHTVRESAKGSTNSVAGAEEQTENISLVSQGSAGGSFSVPDTDAPAESKVGASTQKQQHESSRGMVPGLAEVFGTGETISTPSDGSPRLPGDFSFLAATSDYTLAAGSADSCPHAAVPSSAPQASDAASVSPDGPSALVTAALFTDRPPLQPVDTSLSPASVLLSAVAGAPSAGGATSPAAAGAAAEVAAQREEEVCAFESIYACPVCSPLGEVCPPHHFSYYYHDPSSASFGCGTITTSASFSVEQDALNVVPSPPAGPGNRGDASGGPCSASSAAAASSSSSNSSSSIIADAPSTQAAVKPAVPARLSGATSSVPFHNGVVGLRKTETAMRGSRRSSSILAPEATTGRDTVLDAKKEQFAQGIGPAGPVSSLTTLGAATGLLRTAAEETLNAEAPNTRRDINGVSSGDGNGSSHFKRQHSEKLTSIPQPLSAALSAMMPNATGPAGQCSSVITARARPPGSGAPVAPSESDGTPATGRAADPAGTAKLAHLNPHAPATTLSNAYTAAVPVGGRADATPSSGPPEAVASPPAYAAAAQATATPAATGLQSTATPLSVRRKLANSSTTAQQRRRLRACKMGGGLCMKEKCGCSALPPLLRLTCSTQELLQIALEASPKETLRELFDLGRADAFRWLVLEYMRCEDDLIRRRSVAAKTAHGQKQQQVQANGLNVLGTATAGSYGNAASARTTTPRHMPNSSFFGPSLRQRWKSVSGRWGRPGATRGTATTHKQHRSSSTHTSTPTGEGGDPIDLYLHHAKKEDSEMALPEASAAAAAVIGVPSAVSAGRSVAAEGRGKRPGIPAVATEGLRSSPEVTKEAYTDYAGNVRSGGVPALSSATGRLSEPQSSVSLQRQKEWLEQSFPAPSGIPFRLRHAPGSGQHQEPLRRKQSTRCLRTPNAAELRQSSNSDMAAATTAPLPAASAGGKCASSAGAAEGTEPVSAAVVYTTNATTKPCTTAPAAQPEHMDTQEEGRAPEHAASVPAALAAAPGFEGAVTASTTQRDFFMEQHASHQSKQESARSFPAAAANFLHNSVADPSKRNVGVAAVRQDIDGTPCAGERPAARRRKETGVAASDLQPHDNGQKARTDMNHPIQLQLTAEKNRYKALLEEQLAGGSLAGYHRQRSYTCRYRGVERQRSRSMPPTVSRHTFVCSMCPASGVQSDSAAQRVCDACRLEAALLSGKQQTKKTRHREEPGTVIRRRSSSRADMPRDSCGRSAVEAHPSGNLLPIFLLLQDAPLCVRYSHIYTHSNLWNGDGSICMRPEEHMLSRVVSACGSKKVDN